MHPYTYNHTATGRCDPWSQEFGHRVQRRRLQVRRAQHDERFERLS